MTDKPAKKESKEKKPPHNKFWDSTKQGSNASYYASTRGLDIKDPRVKVIIRTAMRQKEKLKNRKQKESDKKAGISNQARQFMDHIKELEKTKDVILPEDIPADKSKLSNFEKTAQEIIRHTLPANLEKGPLPPPTGYNSRDGTKWDYPEDLQNRKRVDYMESDGKREKLPIFRDDIDWIEFFLGDPETGGTLLRPKGTEELNYIKSVKKLGKLYNIQCEMSHYLDDNPWAKFEVWRGAGKTVVVIGKLLRRICDNPNECLFMQSETDAKTIQRIRSIKRELQTNQKIITYYGYLPADSDSSGDKPTTLGKNYKGSWSQAILELKRDYAGIEPTIMGISWQSGRGVGYHYTGGVLDDPWSVKNQITQGAQEKFWEWWGEFYGSLEGAKFCWVLCTKKDSEDPYTKMDKDKLFASFRRNLVLEWPENVDYIEKNGAYVDVSIRGKKVNYPYVADDCFGKYTIEKCLLIAKRIGMHVFEREYQNNPRRLTGKLFNWSKVKFCDKNAADPYARIPYVPSAELDGLFIYDPAFGLTFDASYNALLAMARYERRIYILYAWIGHWSKGERVAAFKEAKEMFPNFPFYCEDVMQQLNVIRDLMSDTDITFRAFNPVGKGQKFRDLFMGQKDGAKKAKIYDGLEPVVEDGRLYLMSSMPHVDEFENEFKNFPDCLKFDMIDAASMGSLLLDEKRVNDKVLASGYVSKDEIIPNFSIGRQFTLNHTSNSFNRGIR